MIWFSLAEISVIAVLIWGWFNIDWSWAPRPGSLPIHLVYYLNQAKLAGLFAFIIILFAAGGGLLSRVLGHNVFVIGGEISFTVYLFHQIPIYWLDKKLLVSCLEFIRISFSVITHFCPDHSLCDMALA